MPPTYSGPDDALAGARGAGNAIAGQRCNPRSTQSAAAPSALRRRRHAEAIHRLGPRVLAELIDEIRRHHPAIVDDIDWRIYRYAALDPVILAAAGGDRFPRPPLHAIRAAR